MTQHDRMFRLTSLSAMSAMVVSVDAHAQSHPAWAPDTFYAAGTVVSYNGRLYRATVSQTDYAATGWNPTVASLWTDIGPAAGNPPPPAPNPPPPPPPPSSATSWDANTAYTAGNVVTYQGVSYRANWWTRGDDPASNAGPAGSGKPWTQVGVGNPPSPTPPPPPPPVPPPPQPPPDGSLPKHALIGYWHNFTNPSGPTIPISQISNDFDVIVVAFGDDAGNGNVAFNLDPGAGSEAQFIADVAAVRSRGKKVVLSLGGQNGTVTLNNATQVQNFVDSLYNIITRYGFDGIDIDLESGAGVIQGAPVIANIVTAVKQLKSRVGPSFYLSMAPEHPYVHGGYVVYGGIWGAYLPIIDGLRDELTVLHVQYYNNGAVYTPYSGSGLAEGSVDMLVGASRMLIEGFTSNYGAGPYAFRGLRPDQVAFGLPSGPSSANSGLASAAAVSSALNCITRLINCGAIKPAQAYPTFRGVMTWSINWDRRDGFNFSRPARDALNSLP